MDQMWSGMQAHGNRTADLEDRAPGLRCSKHEARLCEILKEVRQLLESYAPTWYTAALSKKIETALKPCKPTSKSFGSKARN